MHKASLFIEYNCDNTFVVMIFVFFRHRCLTFQRSNPNPYFHWVFPQPASQLWLETRTATTAGESDFAIECEHNTSGLSAFVLCAIRSGAIVCELPTLQCVPGT